MALTIDSVSSLVPEYDSQITINYSGAAGLLTSVSSSGGAWNIVSDDGTTAVIDVINPAIFNPGLANPYPIHRFETPIVLTLNDGATTDTETLEIQIKANELYGQITEIHPDGAYPNDGASIGNWVHVTNINNLTFDVGTGLSESLNGEYASATYRVYDVEWGPTATVEYFEQIIPDGTYNLILSGKRLDGTTNSNNNTVTVGVSPDAFLIINSVSSTSTAGTLTLTSVSNVDIVLTTVNTSTSAGSLTTSLDTSSSIDFGAITSVSTANPLTLVTETLTDLDITFGNVTTTSTTNALSILAEGNISLAFNNVSSISTADSLTLSTPQNVDISFENVNSVTNIGEFTLGTDVYVGFGSVVSSSNAGNLIIQTLAPDTVKPVITLVGSSVVRIGVGTEYIEYGATALDDRDGDLTSEIQVSSNVNSNEIGTYQVTYSVFDSSSNQANIVTRTVYVEEYVPITTDYIPYLLETDRQSAIVFKSRGNRIRISLKHEASLVDLASFDYFELHGLTSVPINTVENSVIEVHGLGIITLDLGEITTKTGIHKTMLIGYSAEYPAGAVLWHPALPNSRVTVNIIG